MNLTHLLAKNGQKLSKPPKVKPFCENCAICGKIEVNKSFLKIFEFFENIFKSHVPL